MAFASLTSLKFPSIGAPISAPSSRMKRSSTAKAKSAAFLSLAGRCGNGCCASLRYADRLADELKDLDWPEGIKLLQRNWIGRSEGADIEFKIENGDERIRVFTTRPDTIYGANYMVLAPEHPLVDRLTSTDRRAEVAKYREQVSAKSDLERTDLAKEKTGAFIGAYAINPVNEEKIPIWIADYVLMGYGTGAIMGVPGHDERDLEFARKFELEILPVVQVPGKTPDESIGCLDDGIAINSPLINGLTTPEAKKKIVAWLEEKEQGRADVRFKLRDWLFSRQRYWGEPFPVIWENGKHHSLGEKELPLVPPELEDYKPTGTGEPPLAKAKDWIRYSEKATRETNTMPQWAGSCWYYLRFCDPANDSRFVGEEAERYWMGGAQPGGVDLYVGGTEHAVLHLLYARFWHKVLFDLGYLSKPEPFQRLVNQGMILGEDNRKMSKRWGNVIDPLDVITEYGADALRCYEMFMGPLEQMKPWSMKGVEGVSRFLARVWRLLMDGKSGGRMGAIATRAGCSHRKIAAENFARHDQESDRRHRVALFQYRDLADDGFRQRVHQRARHSRFGHADLFGGAVSFRASPGR